jgi:hypothetical protein
MNGISLPLTLISGDETINREVTVKQAVIAGWTGRDPDLVDKHIRELEELGVPRPPTTPVFYRVAARRLTIEPSIEVVGEQSGGEVEFILLRTGSRLWVGVGSDHTDRAAETYNVTVSKQMCEKPLAAIFWNFEDVAPHWDQLTLRSWVREDGERQSYQDGSVTAMLAPSNLLHRYLKSGELEEATLMFCGTLPATGGVRPTDSFEFELEDPVLQRKISHQYSTLQLPMY